MAFFTKSTNVNRATQLGKEDSTDSFYGSTGKIN